MTDEQTSRHTYVIFSDTSARKLYSSKKENLAQSCQSFVFVHELAEKKQMRSIMGVYRESTTLSTTDKGEILVSNIYRKVLR